MTMQLIETVTVGSTASVITFNSIPQTGTDLLVLLSTRASTATGNTTLRLLVNNDDGVTQQVYTAKALTGTGSAAGSLGSSGTQGFFDIYTIPGNNLTASVFSNIALTIPNYTGSTNKSFSVDGVSEDNNTAAYQTIFAGQRASTEAITKLTFYFAGYGTATQYSTASLYTITKGSGGATVS